MSLSPEPQAKISPLTCMDICDDIWAGSIQYAKEAGYSLNPMVTTMVWAGFFYTIKSDLDKYQISESVKKQFIPALSHIYNIGLDRVDFLAEVNQKMESLLSILSEDMEDLHSDMELLVFLGLVEKVNEQLGVKSDELTIMDRIKQFHRYHSLLSSHVYNIVHKIDNEMLLQFQPLPSRPSKSPVAQPISTKESNKASSKSKFEKLSLAIALILLVVIVVGARMSGNSLPDRSTIPTETQIVLEAKARPSSGIMVSSNMSEGVAPFEVYAPKDYDCFCVLRSTINPDRLVKFYVRAGRFYEILVPLGSYEMYHATGKDWYGLDHLFGEDTVYSKCDEIFEFTIEKDGYSGWTVELERQSGGNLDSHRVDADEFP